MKRGAGWRSVAVLALVAAGSAVAPAFARPRSFPAPAQDSSALHVASLDRKLADLEAEESALKEEMGGLGGAIADARARTLQHGKAFYRLTRAGLLPVGGGFDQLVRHALKVERSRRALAGDIVKERSLRQRGGEIGRALERIARDHVTLAAQRTQLDAARAAAEAEQRRQSAFDRAFETSTGAVGDYVAIYGGNAAVEPAGRGTGFASARGRLLFPVAGRAEVRPARREGTDGPGLEIHAPIGAPVRAVFAGRVAFADKYGPYGRILILDHGDHYYTVSGNLAGLDVKVGDEVSAGERIGSIGDDGQGPMLYFEVRHGTDTVPPSPWLGL